MEASAYLAVSQYNDVLFGQVFYAGDSLAGEAWESRDWQDRGEIREFVLRLAIEACLRI